MMMIIIIIKRQFDYIIYLFAFFFLSSLFAGPLLNPLRTYHNFHISNLVACFISPSKSKLQSDPRVDTVSQLGAAASCPDLKEKRARCAGHTVNKSIITLWLESFAAAADGWITSVCIVFFTGTKSVCWRFAVKAVKAFTLKNMNIFQKMPVDASQEQKSMFAPGWCFNCAKPPASDKTASLSPSFFSEGASFTTSVSSPSVVVHANRLQRNSIHDRGVYPQSLQRGQRSFTDCLARWWTNAFSRKGVEQFVNVRQNFEKGL